MFCVYLSAVGFESLGKGQGPRTRAFVGRSIVSLGDPNIWLEHFGKRGLIQTFFFLYTRCPLLDLKCYVYWCLQCTGGGKSNDGTVGKQPSGVGQEGTRIERHVQQRIERFACAIDPRNGKE